MLNTCSVGYGRAEKIASCFRRLLCGALSTILLVVGLALFTSCGKSDENTEDSNAVAIPTLAITADGDNAPKVEIDKNAKITVDIEGEADGEQPIVHDVFQVFDKGNGAPIRDNQNVRIKYLMYTMPGFTNIYSSWDEGNSSQTFPMKPNAGDPNDIYTVLQGLNVGAVFAQAIPGQNPNQDNGNSDGGSLPANAVDKTGAFWTLRIYYIADATDVVLRAGGADVADVDPNLPTVTLAENGEPSIEIPEGYSDVDELITQPLKIGDGEPITLEETVSFQYTAWRLDGTKIQSTWATPNSPISFSLNQANAGWKEALVGKTVGSQYLLVIPANMTNDESSGTQIFVVDILDVLS
jgi:peptidylprolyl isomerase